MSHGVVCKYHYRGKLSLWLTSVTVWLILREGVAKSPCRCGSIAEIYKIQIFQPHQVALVFDPVEDGFEICNARKNRGDKADRANARIIDLLHGIQTPPDADGVVHISFEILVQCVDGPGNRDLSHYPPLVSAYLMEYVKVWSASKACLCAQSLDIRPRGRVKNFSHFGL